MGAATAHNARGYVYGTRGWRQRAYEAYLRAWELDPNDNSAMNNVAASLQARGRLDEALTWWERALRIDPRSVLYRDHIAFTYQTIGDTAQALRIRQEVLAGLNPEGNEALQVQAELEVLESHDYARALEIREELVEGDPGSTNFRIEAAEAAFIVGDFQRVIEHLVEANRNSPNLLGATQGGAERPRPILLYGMALMQMGQEDEARELLGEFIQLRRGQIAEGNEDPHPWLDLTAAHAALAETTEALEAFEEAHRIGRGFVAGLLGPRDGYGAALGLTSLPSETRFQAVLSQLEDDVAEMRERIEAR